MHVAIREIQVSVSSRERMDGPSQETPKDVAGTGPLRTKGAGMELAEGPGGQGTKEAQLLPRHHAMPVCNLPFGAGPRTGMPPVVPWPLAPTPLPGTVLFSRGPTGHGTASRRSLGANKRDALLAVMKKNRQGRGGRGGGGSSGLSHPQPSSLTPWVLF